MRSGIVEGEPGIFPQPVFRVLRAVGRIFSRGRRSDPPPPGDAGPPGSPGPTPGATPDDAPVDVSELDPKPPPDRSPDA